MPTFEDGPWATGCDSAGDPCTLPAGAYQWAENCINRGGILSTRPGQRVVIADNVTLISGLKIFTPRGGIPCIVFSDGGKIYKQNYPFTSDVSIEQVGDLEFSVSERVEFEIAVVGVIEDSDGNITQIEPYPVVMIYDGQGRTAYWDGTTARHLDPDPDGAHETPICTWGKWIGNRFWALQGRKLRASNLLNPLKYTEEDILAEGGYFNLPDDGTGLGVTPDFRSLLAFTDFTTTSFQSGILNRAQWAATPDFQKVIFSGIGCAAGRSIVNQYGMTWWYSHNGLINLDAALQTYRSSEMRQQDSQMRRSASNLGRDLSGICSVSFGNYLLVSVPSGDMRNYHTWVMDRNPVESIDSPSAWSSVWTGVRPTQYATGAIYGVNRCFCSTSDLPPDGTSDSIVSKGNIWEMFLQDKRDIGFSASSPGVYETIKDISCYFETRLLHVGNLSSIKYVELDIQDAIGPFSIEVWYAARRGTYKKIGSKQGVATVGSITAPMTIPVTFYQYLPQKRTVKSVNESVLSDDVNASVETSFTKNIDKYFSFLIKWTGSLGVSKIRIHTDAAIEAMDGTDEDEELTDRFVSVSGAGEILDSGPTSPALSDQVSGFASANYPRVPTELYQSLT